MYEIQKVELIKRYQNAVKKLILLDYDGTLVDFSPKPERAIPSDKLMKILLNLTCKPEIKVIIISGRGYQDIDKLIGELPIDIIAEHGAMFKINAEWSKNSTNVPLWKSKIMPIFNQITLTCPNSFIEEKLYSISWHYRNAENGYKESRKLISSLETFVNSNKLKILDGNHVVEIISKEIGKGKAVKKIIENTNYDYILSIGDDITDEEMFDFLQNNDKADTIKVGEGKTLAKYKLTSFEDVIKLLNQLSKCD